MARIERRHWQWLMGCMRCSAVQCGPVAGAGLVALFGCRAYLFLHRVSCQYRFAHVRAYNCRRHARNTRACCPTPLFCARCDVFRPRGSVRAFNIEAEDRLHSSAIAQSIFVAIFCVSGFVIWCSNFDMPSNQQLENTRGCRKLSYRLEMDVQRAVTGQPHLPLLWLKLRQAAATPEPEGTGQAARTV